MNTAFSEFSASITLAFTKRNAEKPNFGSSIFKFSAPANAIKIESLSVDLS